MVIPDWQLFPTSTDAEKVELFSEEDDESAKAFAKLLMGHHVWQKTDGLVELPALEKCESSQVPQKPDELPLVIHVIEQDNDKAFLAPSARNMRLYELNRVLHAYGISFVVIDQKELKNSQLASQDDLLSFAATHVQTGVVNLFLSAAVNSKTGGYATLSGLNHQMGFVLVHVDEFDWAPHFLHLLGIRNITAANTDLSQMNCLLGGWQGIEQYSPMPNDVRQKMSVGCDATSQSSLQEAIDHADLDAKVTLCAGVYQENLSLHGLNLQLIGEGDVSMQSKTDDTLIKVIGGSLALSGITLKNGHGQKGGCIHLDDATISLNHVDFTECEADSGGAMYVNDGNVNINNSSFVQNTAKVGAAIYAENSDITCAGSMFSENKSSNEAGGVFLYLSSLKADDCDFEKNQANRGGALVLRRGMANLENSYFEENTAKTSGVFILENGSRLDCDFCGFENNAAEFLPIIGVIDASRMQGKENIFVHSETGAEQVLIKLNGNNAEMEIIDAEWSVNDEAVCLVSVSGEDECQKDLSFPHSYWCSTKTKSCEEY